MLTPNKFGDYDFIVLTTFIYFDLIIINFD